MTERFLNGRVTGAVGILLCLWSCAPWAAPPRSSFAMSAATANVTVSVGEPRGFRLGYLTGGPWSQVQATLMRGSTAIATATGGAIVDATTHARSARLLLSGFAPGDGYSLSLAFTFQGATGGALDAGSLLRDNISLLPGSNIVSIDAGVRQAAIVAKVAPLGTYVDSMPADGPQATLANPRDVAAGLHDDYYYLDDNALHHLYRDAAGVYTTATLAGIPGPTNAGAIDGPGSQSKFQRPSHLIVAPEGSLFVSDSVNNLIRKVTLDNSGAAVVSTLAGTGNAALLDGPGITASFSSPQQLGLTPAGDLLVADSGNHAIRLVTLSGAAPVVTTVAGGQGAGFLDGPASTAAFNEPQGLALAAFS